MLFLDGVYEVSSPHGDRPRFQWVREPTSAQLTHLAHTIARRVGRLLEREGLLERDTEQPDLGDVLDADDPAQAMEALRFSAPAERSEAGMPLRVADLVGHSVTYRIAVGPHRGRKVFTLQTLPTFDDEDWPTGGPGQVAAFSLHAGVAVKACQRDKLERLCRYICRPPVSEKRLFLTQRGDIGYTLKTPYRDGTTHVIFQALDFIARLAALVPPPRLNLTRFHGVFAPNSPWRARITPARRGRGAKPTNPTRTEDRTPAEQRSAMRWAKRLKRVFLIDVETCPSCGGTVQLIACTRDGSTPGLLALRANRPCVPACAEDPPVIERILNHLSSKGLPGLWAESRAPPAERGRLLN